MAKRCSKYNHHGATYRFSWVQTEGQSVLPAHIHHQAAAMRPLQRFRKCSTLCHEGRRLKIGYPRIVAPLYGISAEKDDFVMGVLAIFHGGNLEIMEQTTGIQPMFGKKTIFSWGYNRPSGNSPIQADEPTPLSSTWWAAWHPKSLL